LAKRSGGAFTLVEIMVVVVMIGLLAAIAIPAFKRVQERSQASRIANDFRVFAEVFQRYNFINGQWPPTTGAGSIPAGMSGYLPSNYTNVTVGGGRFGWEQGSTPILYMVGTTASVAVMTRVDAILDDGNLSTGDFQEINASDVLHSDPLNPVGLASVWFPVRSSKGDPISVSQRLGLHQRGSSGNRVGASKRQQLLLPNLF
jgi:prepilin-type N-terminal cleavage/methylation domain-containing protein